MRALALRLAGVALAFSCLSLPAWAADPYDEAADARAELSSAKAAAASERRPLLVVFGANWCPDCRVLDQAFKQGPAAGLIAKQFKVVKINVGRFDRNVDLAQALGVPLKKGIPAVAVVSPQGPVVHVTQQGELASARSMGDQAIHDYFAQIAAKASGS